MNFGLREFHQLDEDTKLSNMLKHSLQQQENYGEYRKTLLHFHTPASHDYKLKKNNCFLSYKDFDSSQLTEMAQESGLFEYSKITLEYLNNIVISSFYKDLKELLSYLLIAQRLFCQGIELAIITDHNTLSGFDKLKDSVCIIKKCLPEDIVIPVVQLGVEISCGDSLHVVGIFDESNSTRQSLETFLSENLVSEKAGSFLPSWKVIEEIERMGGIGYIAHFNSSNIFKDDFGYSGAYKKKLLSAKNMRIVGLSDLKQKIYIDNKLIKDRKLSLNSITYLLDEDSHELDSLAQTSFWLKGQVINFDMIVNALHDSDVSVCYDDPRLPEIYIKSINIDGNGFIGKPDNSFGSVAKF